MKNSIAYLPKDKQEDLNFLINEVSKRLPQTEYIILYGSYARDNYVKRAIRVEDGGIPTVKISDYDILVITSGINPKKAETILDNVEDIFFAGKDFDRDKPVQFINDDIKTFNKYIEEGRYFYTQIKEATLYTHLFSVVLVFIIACNYYLYIADIQMFKLV